MAYSGTLIPLCLDANLGDFTLKALAFLEHGLVSLNQFDCRIFPFKRIYSLLKFKLVASQFPGIEAKWKQASALGAYSMLSRKAIQDLV